AGREKWEQPLFHTVLREAVAARSSVAYVPSSATAGAFPHTSNRGPSSYYGVGAYRRPLEDARRAEVVFASECLGFSNLAATGEATRVPADLCASWDFADIRDYYAQLLVGGDAELGRVITGEVMARTFAEWRRARSVTRGGLVWFLRDLWPSAGWGVLDDRGIPKPAWYVLRRALAPNALAFSDEGTNGLVLHAFADREPIEGVLELALWRDSVSVGKASRPVRVEVGARFELEASELFEGWYDLSYAYRFGPPTCDVVHAKLGELEAFFFPAGIPVVRDPDVGLSVERDGDHVVVAAKRFARYVVIDGEAEDNYFHLAPGQQRRIRCASDVTVRLT
ncbi:MAG TPA: glycoside hydrolase family 2 protein, partial [Kofleriaceae bacterium]